MRPSPLARAASLLALAALLVVGLLVRLWVLRTSDDLNADEVLPGLMALHIAQGRELPVFFYGQQYFGALEAYFVAGLFRWLGFSPSLLLVPPTVASLALIPLTYALASRVAGRTAGLLASIPIAVPPPILAKLFVNTGGGFSLAFALQGMVLLCTLIAVASSRRGWRGPVWLAIASFLAGFLCWVWQPALLLYPAMWLAAVLALALWRRPFVLILATLPVVIGLAPPVLYNAARGWPTLAQVGAKYVAPANEAASGEWSGPRAVLSFAFTALGGGNEAEGGTNEAQAVLAAGSIPLALLLLLRGRSAGDPGYGQRRTAAAVLVLAAAVDAAAAHSTVRHLVPAALIAFVFLGAALALLVGWLPARLRPLGWFGVLLIESACVVAPNLWLDAHADQVFQRFTASITDVRATVAALDERGLRTGYSDYWSVYPIAYFSQEQIVLAPSLPVVWGGRFDRYPAYTATVDGVQDLRQVFVLLDDRCSPLPYMLLLEQADARYRAEHVGRWVLLWDVEAPPGQADTVLAAWRRLMGSQDNC